MWKPLDTPGRSSGNWIIVDQTKNCFSWEDFVGALGGLSKHWCSEMCGQLGNRWRSLVLGRESSGRSPGAWNKEEILGKTSMIWVIFSQSLQWLWGNDFVGRQRSRNGEKGKGTTCILAWSEQSCWTHTGGRHRRCHGLGCLQAAWVWMWQKQREQDDHWNIDGYTVILPFLHGDGFLWTEYLFPISYSTSHTPQTHPTNSYFKALLPRVMEVEVTLGYN